MSEVLSGGEQGRGSGQRLRRRTVVTHPNFAEHAEPSSPREQLIRAGEQRMMAPRGLDQRWAPQGINPVVRREGTIEG